MRNEMIWTTGGEIAARRRSRSCVTAILRRHCLSDCLLCPLLRAAQEYGRCLQTDGGEEHSIYIGPRSPGY